MVFQFDDPSLNAALDALETTAGPGAILRLYNAVSPPTNTSAAITGTLIAQGTLPPDWMAAAASGSKSRLGTWTITGQPGAGAGTNATYGRIWSSDGTTCRMQFLAGGTVQIPTTALTAANGNVLTFSSTTGIAVGMRVTGTGILPSTYVIALTGTTVTLSRSSTAGVASAASITHNWDCTLDNPSIAENQSVTVQSFNLSASGA